MKAKLTAEQKEANKLARINAKKAEKLQREIDNLKYQKPVRQIDINIEWIKSRTWGMNPHATARVQYQDGTSFYQDGFTCSGCGYDKESTVISEIFNRFLAYKLWQIDPGKSVPYGIREYSGKKGYEGGVGTSCYYRIGEYLGGKFEHLAGGKSFDVYTYSE